jgi:transposase
MQMNEQAGGFRRQWNKSRIAAYTRMGLTTEEIASKLGISEAAAETIRREGWGEFDPYESAPSCHLDLPRLTRYAKESGKALADLTTEEAARFIL